MADYKLASYKRLYLMQGESDSIEFAIQDTDGTAINPDSATFTLLNEKYTRVRARLVEDLSSSATTVEMDSGRGFPDEFNGTKYIQIADEIMSYTESDINGGKITVTRAQKDTSAAAHYENDVVTLWADAASISASAASVGTASPYTVSYALTAAKIATLETDKGFEEYLGKFVVTVTTGVTKVWYLPIVVANYFYCQSEDWMAYESDINILKKTTTENFRDIHWATRHKIDTYLRQHKRNVPPHDIGEFKVAAILHDLYLVYSRASKREDDLWGGKAAEYKKLFDGELDDILSRMTIDPSTRDDDQIDNTEGVEYGGNYMMVS